VPRIFEKLKAGLETAVAGMPSEQRAAAQAGLDAAIEKVRLEQRDEPVPDEIAAKVAAADEQFFSGWRAMLGLDQVEALNVGAAPTPVEVLEFMHAIGLPLAELWGMSETCGAGAVNPPDRIKIGTVGPPAPGIEIKLDTDGEVLLRGGVVMKGYRNLPDKTAETFTDDGWLRTGDIGEFDEDGYLKIVDRKKELIINAAGKNMSPANIEQTLKASHALIGQAVVIGDRRPFNVALLVLDPDVCAAYAEKAALTDGSAAALAGDAGVQQQIAAAIEAANARLSRVEQIKKYRVLETDWLPGGDELTPTMKLKRRSIGEKYAPVIEELYAGV